MANELRTFYSNESSTLYCIIRKASDLTVYKNSTGAFVNWANADIDDYDIPMTSQDGDLFTADHPDIANGDYLYAFYVQGGASPAITDVRIDAIDGTWNGTDVSSPSGSVVLSGYALATLDEVKRELNITGTDDDDLLTQHINQATEIFETQVGRKIVAREYIELYRANSSFVVLNNYPVIYVKRLGWSSDDAFSLKYTGSGNTAYARIGDDKLVITVVDASGGESDSTFNLDTYKLVSTLKTAVEAAGIDITFTQHENIQTKYLFDTIAVNIAEETRTFEYAELDEEEYKFYKDQGVIGLPSSCVFDNVIVEYKAGYETIPQDITSAAINMVKNMYSLRGGSNNIKSVALDGYSYSLGSDGGNVIIDGYVSSIINKYRDAQLAASTIWR